MSLKEKSPLAEPVYTQGPERTGLSSISACRSNEPNGPPVKHLGRGGKIESLTHIVILRTPQLGFRANRCRAKIEIGIGSRHEKGSRDLSPAHTEYVLKTAASGLQGGILKQWH